MFGSKKKARKRDSKTGPPSFNLDRLPERLAHEHAMRVWRAIPRWRRWMSPKPKAAAGESGAPTSRIEFKPPMPDRPQHLPASGAELWKIDEHAFPHRGGGQQKLKFCLRYAILAPSSHNSQPWRFRLGLRHVDIHADRARALPVTDPDDRELVMSCGAALHHLRLAMKCYGLGEQTDYVGGADDLLARVRLVPNAATSTPHDAALLRAIPRRRTMRSKFDSGPIGTGVLKALRQAATSCGVELTVLEAPSDKSDLASFVAEADLVQMQDRRFRRELASWMHHNRSHTRDGMPGYSMLMNELESLGAPVIVRTFDVGGGRAAADQELAKHCGAVLILSTSGDGPNDWLRAGEALAHVLLESHVAGLHASYLNQPVEIEQVRPRLASHFAIDGHPQLVVRVGRTDRPLPPHTPRRPLDEVVTWTDIELDEDLPVAASSAAG